MDENLKRNLAALLVLLFATACPVMAADPGGGSSTEDESSAMTYITIGVIVLVGGLLALDAINDAGESEPVEIIPEFENVDTGVNWSQVFPDESFQTMVAIAIFPGTEGRETASQLADLLRYQVPENVSLYSDPVDLGQGDPVEMARMAREFFGADMLLLESGNPDFLQVQAYAGDSLVWTSPSEPDIGLSGIVEDLLQAGVF